MNNDNLQSNEHLKGLDTKALIAELIKELGKYRSLLERVKIQRQLAHEPMVKKVSLELQYYLDRSFSDNFLQEQFTLRLMGMQEYLHTRNSKTLSPLIAPFIAEMHIRKWGAEHSGAAAILVESYQSYNRFPVGWREIQGDLPEQVSDATFIQLKTSFFKIALCFLSLTDSEKVKWTEFSGFEYLVVPGRQTAALQILRDLFTAFQDERFSGEETAKKAKLINLLLGFVAFLEKYYPSDSLLDAFKPFASFLQSKTKQEVNDTLTNKSISASFSKFWSTEKAVPRLTEEALSFFNKFSTLQNRLGPVSEFSEAMIQRIETRRYKDELILPESLSESGNVPAPKHLFDSEKYSKKFFKALQQEPREFSDNKIFEEFFQRLPHWVLLFFTALEDYQTDDATLDALLACYRFSLIDLEKEANLDEHAFHIATLRMIPDPVQMLLALFRSLDADLHINAKKIKKDLLPCYLLFEGVPFEEVKAILNTDENTASAHLSHYLLNWQPPVFSPFNLSKEFLKSMGIGFFAQSDRAMQLDKISFNALKERYTKRDGNLIFQENDMRRVVENGSQQTARMRK